MAIGIAVTYYDVKKRKVIWEKERVEDWGAYDPSDPTAREEGIKEAADKLARQMIDLTLSDW